MKKIVYNILFLIGFSSLFILQSCNEQWLDPTLSTSKSYESGISNEEDVFGILLGAYDRMSSSDYYGRNYIIYGEVRSDDAFANGNSGRFVNVATFNIDADDGYAHDTWEQIYQVIANANIVIAQDPTKLEGDPDVINDYRGQAYAIRALAHFDLLKLYGQQNITGGDNTLGIPYIFRYKSANVTPARNSVDEVKADIYADLDSAMMFLSDEQSSIYFSKDAGCC